MNETIHYHEEDFQNYLENSLEGNAAAFESHIKECPSCSANLEAYSQVWSFIKNDVKIEDLKIDLAKSVADKVFRIEPRYVVADNAMYALVLALGFISITFCLQYLASLSIPKGFILLIIPGCLYFWVSMEEVKALNKRAISFKI